MSSNVYNHRSLQPGGPVAAPPTSLGLAPGHGLQRLTDSFDIIRQEYDMLASDVGVLRSQRDECEAKLASQVNELNIIRQALYELETQHTKIRQQYEDELAKLRAEVLSAARQGSTAARTASSSTLPYEYYRDRDRERDRERERLADSRDPKRLKVERRSEFMPPSTMLPKMPPLTPSGAAGPLSGLTSPKSSWRPTERDPPPSAVQPGASPKVSINPQPPTINLAGRDPRDSPSDSREREPGPLPPQPPPPQPPQSSSRERDRERDLAIVTRGRAASPALMSARDPNPNPIILADLDPQHLPPELRKEETEWFCIFNPNLTPPNSKPRKNLELALLWTFPHTTVVCCVQFSSDGKFLATGCNRSAQIFDVKTGNKMCILTDDTAGSSGDLYIRSVRFSPDGRYLATGAEDKRIRIWDIQRKKIVVTFTGHTQEIYALDFTPDGRSIVSGSGDKTARIWNLAPFITLPGGGTSSPSPTSANPDDPRNCMILTISDSPTGATTTTTTTTTTVTATGGAVSSSVSASNADQVNEAGNASSATDKGVTSVAVSPDGKYLAAGSLDCLVRIWDIPSGTLLERLQGHQNSVYSVVFTPDGRGVISGSLDRTMKYWDVSWLYTTNPVANRKEGGKCLMNFIGHKDYVLSVAVSHDSRWIVSGSKDRGVQFWDSRTSAVQCMLQGHKNSVISIALNPVSDLLASGSGDNLARIWKYTNTS